MAQHLLSLKLNFKHDLCDKNVHCMHVFFPQYINLPKSCVQLYVSIDVQVVLPVVLQFPLKFNDILVLENLIMKMRM